MKMIKTFFDYLSIADAERIHTQFLAWMFSEDNVGLDNTTKINLLFSFLGEKPIISNSTIKTYTEIDSIDLILTIDNNAYVIENKLKSSVHSNQLNKYKELLEDKQHRLATSNNYYLLSLINEKPPAKSHYWKNVTYEKLRDSIKEKISGIPKNHEHFNILLEYKKTLDNLVSIVKAFERDHTQFPSVFSEGKLKKSDKKKKYKEKNEVEKYISDNQLETILQKLFLIMVVNQLKPSIDPDDYVIAETHGNALLNIHLKKSIKIGNNKFNLCIQFQGDTVKINFQADDYWKSKKKWLTQKSIDNFKKCFHNNNHGFKRFNQPTSKAYISVSKKLNVSIKSTSINEIKDIMQKEIGQVISVIPNFEV